MIFVWYYSFTGVYLASMVKLFIRYQKARFSNVQRLVNQLAQSMDAEALHTLRVELKRVRFLKTILDQHEKPRKVDKAYKPFKKLFEQVGKIRGQHVNMHRLSKTLKQNDESKARKHFKRKQKHLEKQFNDMITHHTSGLSQGMLAMDAMLKNMPELSEKDFLKHLIKQVGKRINLKTPTRKWHAGRHALKSVIYSAELSNALASKIASVFNMAVIVNLEDAIGDWHDFTILLNGKSAKWLTENDMKKMRRKRKIEQKRIGKLMPQVFRLGNTTP